MQNERQFTLKIKTLRYGQPRAYADSDYEYEIEAEGINEFEVKQYCTKVLQQCSQTSEQWDKHNADSYFRGYYVFSKISENNYKYHVHQPFCD